MSGKLKLVTVLISFIYVFLQFSLPSSHANSSLELKSFRFNQKEQKLEKSFQRVEEQVVHDRQILIKVKDGQTLPDYYQIQLLNTSKELEDRNIYIARVPNNKDFDLKIKELEKSPKIEFVDRNVIVNSKNAPNDPYFNQQWYLNTTKIQSGWTLINNSNSVTVAVIDSGIDFNHPDLSGRILPGYNFVSYNTNPFDTVGHGTNVAGLIAANLDNGVGIAGISKNVMILPIKAGDETQFRLADTISAIYYAIDHGADIINMSYGSAYSNDFEYDALREAYLNNILLVAAAGNDGSLVNYPAAYPFVLAVGSVNDKNVKSTFSSFGSELDLAAPGEKIITTSPNGAYSVVDGTSFSSPIISGLGALILSERVGLTPSQIEWLVESSSSSSWNQNTGFGNVDAYKALSASLPDLSKDVSNNQSAARELEANKKYLDQINLPDDIDWYSFSIKDSSEVEISLQGTVSNDLVMYVGKYQNDTLVSENVFDYSAIGGNESYHFQADPGTYKIAVFDYNFRWSDDPYSITLKKQQIERVSGIGRIETAIEISKKGWPIGLDHQEKAVILARADNPADALSAASLAGVKDAPILLTKSNSVDQSIIKELARLKTKKVYLLGGTGAINSEVEKVLKNKGFVVQRINGKDRFETAFKINEVAGTNKSVEAIVVNGITVADALSASSISAINNIPIYLTHSKKLTLQLPSNVKKVTLLGGTAAIHSDVENSLKEKGIQVTRISGKDRYETNINAISSRVNPQSLIIVRGTSTSKEKEDYPDAVAASGLADLMGGAIVLSHPTQGQEVIRRYVAGKILPVYVLGGENAVSDSALRELGLR